MEDFRDIERAHDDLLADEAGEYIASRPPSVEERLAALTLNRRCVRCGGEIEAPRFALGSTECEDCKPRQAAA